MNQIQNNQQYTHLNKAELPKKKLEEIKRLEEKSIELEAEFFLPFLKEITKSFSNNGKKGDAMTDTIGDMLGLEIAKKMGDFTGHRFAKDIICQESNKIVKE